MDSNNSRLQRTSLSFPYLESFGDALSLDGHSPLVDVDMDETWKLFGMQSPQCISQDHQAGLGTTFRTPHDDLCAHPPKCPTGGHYSSNSSSHNGLHHGGNASSSHMLFHTRHFDPQVMSSGHHGQHQHNMQGIPTSAGGTEVSGLDLMGFTAGSFFPQSGIPTSVGPTASGVKPSTYANDFAEQLSVLSSPPTQHSMHSGAGAGGVDDDVESTCDSDCSFGEICHDSACSDDPSACCEDEDCLQEPGVVPVTAAVSPEDAIAAAALTSFVEQQRQASEQQQQHQQQHMSVAASSTSGMHSYQGHHHSASSTSTPSCLQFGLGPDLCISPQFLINYQHLREAHNPLNPSECTASFCPVEDPNFYQECHIRHLPEGQGGLFDNLDLNMIMNENANHAHSHGLDNHGQNHSHSHSHSHEHTHNHMDAVECGAKFPSGEAMIEHLWNEHRKSLNLLRFPAMQQNLHMDQAPGMASSASSSVSLASQDLARTPSLAASGQDIAAGLSLPDATLPLGTYDFDPSHTGGLKGATAQQQPQDTAMAMPRATKLETQLPLSGGLGLKIEDVQSKTVDGALDMDLQVFECVWCDTVGGQTCGQTFESAGELHKHVLAAHTHLLKRDVGGTYSCGWQGCTRRDSEEKGGFAQKSKIDRHMQVHTGSMFPPFLSFFFWPPLSVPPAF